MGRWMDRVRKAGRLGDKKITARPIPGDLIRWEGSDGKTQGPAVIQQVTIDDTRRRWVWVELQGSGQWISEVIVQRISQEHSQ
jgi:hypothetical protein